MDQKWKNLSKLAQKNINVDIILQSVGRDGTKDITFTVSRENSAQAEQAIKSLSSCKDSQVVIDENVAKVSLVGAGMETHPATASRMFEALYSADVNIQMISTSEIKISVLIEKEAADKAVKAIHNAFFD